MLRRLKKDVIKQLPAKQERIVKCQMTEAQRDCYSDIKLSLAKTFKVRNQALKRKLAIKWTFISLSNRLYEGDLCKLFMCCKMLLYSNN